MIETIQIMKIKASTMLVDRFTGAEFTAEKISKIVVEMAKTESEEKIDRFLDRFSVRESK